jgi:hypothetical protein
MNKYVREIVRTLGLEGVEVLRITQRGKHLRVETTAGLYVCPVSPGDFRIFKEIRAWARRASRPA